MSSEDFKSFIVTNPDLVDEGIDISGLRTNTDASILGNIPDYGGIQYEAYNPNRLSDLMRLYSGGFPMLDTPQATQDFTGGQMIDTGNGSMDQATLPGFDDPIPEPITPIVAPGEYPSTQEEMDEFNAIPVTQPNTGGITGDPIEMENLSPIDIGTVNDYDDLEDYNKALDAANTPGTIGGAVDVFDINQTGDPSQNPGSINVGDQPMAAGPFDYLQEPSISTIANPEIFDSYGASINDPQIGDPGFQNYTASVDQIEDPTLRDKLSSSLTSATEGLSNVADLTGNKLKEIGTDIAAAVGGVFKPDGSTITVPGLGEINVKQTIGGMILNKVVGGPITLAFSAAKAIAGLLPKDSLENSTTRSIAAQLTAENDYGYNMQSGNIGQDPFGRNPVSAFGNYEQTLAEDAAYVGDSKFNNAKKQYAQDYFNAKAEVAGGVEVDDGTVVGPGEMPGTQETFDEFNEPTQEEKDAATEISNAASVSLGDARHGDGGPGVSTPPSTPAQSGPTYSGMSSIGSGGGGQDSSPSTGGPPSQSSSSPDAGEVSSDAGFEDQSYSGPPSQSSGGGGGGGGGGKIVCTMMNDSYGFGSFRNKIWLKHSKDLAPEYQIGYHKIFLPLVKLSKTNKVVKKILEHIAIHRTIDIRQESRGKTHLLGRVYRKILEPICYLVGKYAK
jgi:hypothetical protein